MPRRATVLTWYASLRVGEVSSTSELIRCGPAVADGVPVASVGVSSRTVASEYRLSNWPASRSTGASLAQFESGSASFLTTWSQPWNRLHAHSWSTVGALRDSVRWRQNNQGSVRLGDGRTDGETSEPNGCTRGWGFGGGARTGTTT
jgi:hypothetical protein